MIAEFGNRYIMKTLQEWLLNTLFESAVNKKNQTPQMQNFYERLCAMDSVIPNPERILFVSEYVGWTDMQNPDYTVSVFSFESNHERSPALTPWRELLGYNVSDMSVESYGIRIVLDTILKDMSFFGTNENDVEKSISDFDKMLLEFQDPTQYSAEDLLKECGLTVDELQMTPEEELMAEHAFQRNAATYDYQIAGIMAQMKQ